MFFTGFCTNLYCLTSIPIQGQALYAYLWFEKCIRFARVNRTKPLATWHSPLIRPPSSLSGGSLYIIALTDTIGLACPCLKFMELLSWWTLEPETCIHTPHTRVLAHMRAHTCTHTHVHTHTHTHTHKHTQTYFYTTTLGLCYLDLHVAQGLSVCH